MSATRREAPRRLWCARHPELGYAVLAVIGSSALVVFVLRLWDATLGIPFAPGGDGYVVLMQIKGVLDHGWVLQNPDLGAPFGQDLHDFAANRELLHFAVVKVLGLFSSNPGAVLNVYFLLSFPLAALAAFLVMRWLGVSRGAAVAMSVLYAFAPFHFRHQTFLFAYYTVPLGAYLVLAVYSEAPLFERRPGQATGPLRYLSRRSVWTLGMCAAVALSSFYFAAFTVILVAIAAAITFAVSRQRRSLAAGAAIATAIVAVGAVAATPDLIYRAQHGTNPVVAKRGPEESLTYSTNLLQLVMPVQDHRLGPLRNLRERWSSSTVVDGEATNLGLTAALGFVWLLVSAVAYCVGGAGRFVRDVRQRHLAAATVTALLVGTTGGVSAFIAYLITPQLRAWTRLSIFIAFFSLAAIGLLLDAAHRALRRRGVRMPPWVVAALLGVVCVVAVLDQTSPSFVPDYEANAASYRSDEAFARQIEETLGDGAMVFQLPYVPFPESPPVVGTGPYDHVRPYLHSKTVRWSFGAMRARPQDWQAELEGAPPETLLPAVAAVGFAGVYVDRAGYTDLGRAVELELERVLDARPRISSDNRFSFFDLRSYGRRLRDRTPRGDLRALAAATLFPLRTDWGDEFSVPEREGPDFARWTVVPDAHLTVTNPSDEHRSATLFVRLVRSDGDAAPVVITYPNGSGDRVDVTAKGIDFKRSLSFPPGDSTIRMTTQAPPIQAPTGMTGYVNLVGWRVTPNVETASRQIR